MTSSNSCNFSGFEECLDVHCVGISDCIENAKVRL